MYTIGYTNWSINKIRRGFRRKCNIVWITTINLKTSGEFSWHNNVYILFSIDFFGGIEFIVTSVSYPKTLHILLNWCEQNKKSIDQSGLATTSIVCSFLISANKYWIVRGNDLSTIYQIFEKFTFIGFSYFYIIDK